MWFTSIVTCQVYPLVVVPEPPDRGQPDHAAGRFGGSCRGKVTVEAEWLVVGGGSAGCVVASRLSEEPGRDVLVLEAGPDWRSADAPSELRSLNFWRALDPDTCGHLMWEGLAVAADRSAADAPAPARAGHRRVVGDQRDDRDPGDARRLRPLGSERVSRVVVSATCSRSCDAWSRTSTSATVRTTAMPDRSRCCARTAPPGVQSTIGLADAATALGYPWADDHNAPGSTGVSPFAINVDRDLRRVSTNDGYIEPHRSRPNLRIIGQATVDRVLIDKGPRLRCAGSAR